VQLGAEPRDDGSSADPKVLGMVLLIQSSFHAMESEAGLAALVARGLERLPGVVAAQLRSDRVTAAAWHGRPELTSIPLRTPRQHYGALELLVKAPEAYAPYAPFISNLANIVALWVENRRQREALERAAAAQRFLAEASRELSESMQEQTTLGTLARLVVPQLAEWCALCLVGADGRPLSLALETLASIGPGPAQALLRQLLEPVGAPLPALLHQRRSLLVADLCDPPARDELLAPATVASLRALGAAAAMFVPLVARGRLLGVLLFAGGPGRFDEVALETAEELARRAAVALENAQLFEEAQEAAHQREEMLAVVSHDLKSPLGAIQLNAEAMLEVLGDDPNRERALRRPVQLIQRAGKRMSRLIRDLLDLDSIRKGRLALELRPLSPCTLVDEAVELIGPLATARQLGLVGERAADLPDVRCDRDRVFQVFENLLSNAIQICEPPGSIYVRAARHDDAGVCFSVEDCGPGISEEDQRYVFDRLWRSRCPGYKGTGRGLAIAQGIVEAHGGRIWVKSTLGAGATFYFTLPLAAAAAAS
jgi:signal transduction histidine kinase